jgi:hypothetical protein
MKTLKELAKEALDVQNACNLCGVAQTFARVMIDLGKHCSGTDERNTHPITIVWLDKLNSLARIQAFEGSGVDRVNEAFNQVIQLSEGDEK